METALSDDRLFPLLDEDGRRLLRRLREHPHAPRYNYRTGERLNQASLASVRAYAQQLSTERRGWQFGQLPPWLPPFLARCRREVPFYRGLPEWPEDFFALPRLTRQQIRRQPWAFVVDSADVSDLVVYSTSGTTGTSLRLPAWPEVPSRYLPLIQLALAANDVKLEGGNRVSIVQACAQRETYSLVSVSSYLDGAAFVKVNLLPAIWRDPQDRVLFLDDCDPEIYTGDPFAFSKLMELPLRTRPKALVCAAATLLPGLRRKLEEHFACPVIDLYSMNESGPIASSIENGHEILPHNLYVEILSEDGRPCPPGARGEIVVTGGINPLLPLVRYRTGDCASMDYGFPHPRLIGFQGRSPVVFRSGSGELFNSVDVSIALKDLPLAFFRLHQHADGSLRVQADCDAQVGEAIKRILGTLFGPAVPITVEPVGNDMPQGKPIRYTSEISF